MGGVGWWEVRANGWVVVIGEIDRHRPGEKKNEVIVDAHDIVNKMGRRKQREEGREKRREMKKVS